MFNKKRKEFKNILKITNESSNIVLTVRNLEFGYNNESLGNAYFELYKGQKLAIIGDNGKGKSKLIKTLMGLIPKISGKFSYGFNVKKEYFDQQIEFLDENNTIYEEYSKTFPKEEPLQIRKTLGAFQFTGDDVFKQIKLLSGGEKVRLKLFELIQYIYIDCLSFIIHYFYLKTKSFCGIIQPKSCYFIVLKE